MDAWLQSADFSTRDLAPDLDAEGAIRTLSSHDWLAETALSKRLESAGKESCEAGLGLTRADEQSLHICPNGTGTAVVHWHRQARGIFRKRVRVEMYEDVPMSRAQAAIRAYYREDDDEVERLLEGAS